VSREIVASAVLAPDQFGLLALHRHVPERGLVELIERSQRVGEPVRLSLFHFAACEDCTRESLVGEGQLCERGARLVADCAGWRERVA
jgi:hypothetical protein